MTSRTLGSIVITLIAIVTIGALWTQPVVASEGEEEVPPIQQAEIVISFAQYLWWLAHWADNQVVCEVFIEHEGLPTSLEVLYACGEDLYGEWLNTQPCPAVLNKKVSTETYDGLYLFLVDVVPGERILVVDLPVLSI